MFGSDGLLVLADAGLIDYFVDSNKAGKIVICVLAFLNCYAISLMWNKYVLLNKALSRNARDEKRINDLPSIFDYDDALFSGGEVPTYPFVHGQWKRPVAARPMERFG